MYIVSINVKQREEEIPDVQTILTQYGKNIVSRLGLHNTGKNKNGLIIIVYDGQDIDKFKRDLRKIKSISVNTMKIAE